MGRFSWLILIVVVCWSGIWAAPVAAEEPEKAPQMSRETFAGTVGIKAGTSTAEDILYVRGDGNAVWFLGFRGKMPEALVDFLEKAAHDGVALEITGEVARYDNGVQVLDTNQPFTYRPRPAKAKEAVSYSVLRTEISGFPGREVGQTPAGSRYGLRDVEGQLWFLGFGGNLPAADVTSLDKAIAEQAPVRVSGRFYIFSDQTRALDAGAPFEIKREAPASTPASGDAGSSPAAADASGAHATTLDKVLIQGVPHIRKGATTGKDIFLIVDKDGVLWFLGKRGILPDALQAVLDAAVKDKHAVRITGQAALFADGMRVLDLRQPYDCQEDVAALPQPTGREKVLLQMESQAPVYGSPQVKTLLTVTKPTEITRIWTFHWNDGQGETPGTIGLRDVQRDRTLGTWPAVGTRVMFKTKPGVEWPTSGNGPPFRYWAATVGLVVPPGTYEVVDSSPQTWSTNREMGNKGCTWVYGRQ